MAALSAADRWLARLLKLGNRGSTRPSRILARVLLVAGIAARNEGATTVDAVRVFAALLEEAPEPLDAVLAGLDQSPRQLSLCLSQARGTAGTPPAEHGATTLSLEVVSAMASLRAQWLHVGEPWAPPAAIAAALLQASPGLRSSLADCGVDVNALREGLGFSWPAASGGV